MPKQEQPFHENLADVKESQEKEPGLELAKGPELDELTKAANSLANKIEGDEDVYERDLDRLKKALENMKVNLGGLIVSLQELKYRKIVPDLEKFKDQIRFNREIADGNFKNSHRLVFLTEKAINAICKHNGELRLNDLLSARGLNLRKSGIDALVLTSLKSAEGLQLPDVMRGRLILPSLLSARGLVLPRIINGDLDLGGLKSADELILTQVVSGDLDLSGLLSIEGLILPKIVKGRVIIFRIKPAEKARLRKLRPDLEIMDELK